MSDECGACSKVVHVVFVNESSQSPSSPEEADTAAAHLFSIRATDCSRSSFSFFFFKGFFQSGFVVFIESGPTAK